MSIVAPSDFIAEIAIPQTANYFSNGGNLQEFIDKYEKRFLLELFGATFYAELIAGLAVEPKPDPDIWAQLVDETDLKQMICNYVYYWYKRDETTQSVGTGESKNKTDNATPVNSKDKQCRAWNEMANMVRFFDLSTVTYPNWVRRNWRRYSYWVRGCGIPEIYYNINETNI